MITLWLKKHWPAILLYLAGLFYTFANLSNRFDGDFGWQLRFGQEVLGGHFPYLDTYTFSYYGRLWVNHEWGGSVLWWSVYQYIGYNALVLFVAITVWTTFVVIPTVFRMRITSLSLVISLVAMAASNDVLYTRLTVIAPAFFLLLLYTFSRLPEKKYYYWWPLLIWIWGALHGSWILAFIVIGIYVGGKILEYALARIVPSTSYLSTSTWKKNIFIDVIVYTGMSALTLCLNPYGLGIWREVLTYFLHSYYTQYITEWQAAYVYPILIWPLVIGASTTTLAVYAFLRKRISLPELLLYIALQYAAFSHKRNIIYAMLVSVPVLYGTLAAMRDALRVNQRASAFIRSFAPAGMVFVTTCLVAPALSLAHWHSDIWHETFFLEEQGFPARASDKLSVLSASRPVVLFDQFRWGGFFNWRNQNIPVYIDGRGTVSWQVGPTTTLYQDYRTILYQKGGLATLENMGVNTVLLELPGRQFFATDAANAVLFSSRDLATVTTPEASELEKSLDNSPHWKKVYTDSLANIWTRF